jgi:hypothetical protein
MSRHALFRALMMLCLAWGLSPALAGQTGATGPRVSIITVSPGTQIHSYFGHTAVRVTEPSGRDLVFNYGTFTFDDTFLFRFVYGELDYYLSAASYDDAMSLWRFEERSVVEQVLALEAGEAQAYLMFLIDNARPEKRVYRYDFLLDNCTTRVRDGMRSVLGADVDLAVPADEIMVFRESVDPYLTATPFLHLGIDLLMGWPVDTQATRAELAFLPDHLSVLLEGARRLDGNTPLVSETLVLHDNGRSHLPEVAPDWASIVLWALFALAIPWGGRRVFAALLLLVVGAAGLLMFLLWTVSLHHVTDGNLNLLWAWPTHGVAGLVVAFGRKPGWLGPYLRAAAWVSLAAVVAWPFVPQRLPMAALPLALACAFTCFRLGASSRGPTGD